MMERVKQGEIGGVMYSVHYSHGSDDWQIYFEDGTLPAIQFLSHEQLVVTMKLLKDSKEKIRQYKQLKDELSELLGIYGYQGKLHKQKMPETEPELLVEQFEEVGVPYHGYRRGKKE